MLAADQDPVDISKGGCSLINNAVGLLPLLATAYLTGDRIEKDGCFWVFVGGLGLVWFRKKGGGNGVPNSTSFQGFSKIEDIMMITQLTFGVLLDPNGSIFIWDFATLTPQGGCFNPSNKQATKERCFFPAGEFEQAPTEIVALTNKDLIFLTISCVVAAAISYANIWCQSLISAPGLPTFG